jgi:hypothetical protein
MKCLLPTTLFLFILAGCEDHSVHKTLDSKWFDCDSSPMESVRTISFEEGVDMEKAYEECKDCPEPSRYEFDIEDFKTLKGKLDGYGLKVTGVSVVPARYDLKGQERYTCRVCKGDNGDKKCNVEGYETVILKLTVPATKEGFLYFDFVAICPPPSGCDGKEEISSSDSVRTLSTDTTKKIKQ